MTDHDDDSGYDSKYGLYDKGDLTVAADVAIDAFISTLAADERVGPDEALVDRCVEFASDRGVYLIPLGFTDTASREEFYGAIEEDNAEVVTASVIAETLINGNISTAREAIIYKRTATEAVVFAFDVAFEVAAIDGGGVATAMHRVRRCVNPHA